MIPGGGWRRRLARKLLKLASWLLPSPSSEWGTAMLVEGRLIDDDREALSWALGCLRTGLSERLRAWRLYRLWSARSAGILWILIFIVSNAFNVSLTLAVRLQWSQAASLLGRCLRGFDYHRFELLALAMPVALFVLMGVVVLAFCISLYLSLRKRRFAFVAFCCALALSLVAWLYQLGIPAYWQAISTPHRYQSGACFLLTAVVLSVLWLTGRGDPSVASPSAS